MGYVNAIFLPRIKFIVLTSPRIALMFNGVGTEEMMIKTGTSHFISVQAAIWYYADYGETVADVARKLREGSIHIGRPSLKTGERLSLIDPLPNVPERQFRGAKIVRTQGCRYAIESQ